MSDSVPMEVFEDPEEIVELQELEFPQDVIREIARKRTRHESRLALPTVENYMDYIDTERRLLHLVSCRERCPQRKKSLETRLLKKINSLYKEAVNKFNHDYNVMTDYFKFCSQIKAKTRAKEILQLILQHHPEREDAWLTAISWYVNNLAAISKIRDTISRALTSLPVSKEIFKEAFCFELKMMQSSVKTSGSFQTEQFEKFKRYIDMFFDNIERDIDYYFTILKVFDKYESVNEAKDYFLGKIMGSCRDEPALWQNLVKRQEEDLYVTPQYLPEVEETVAQCAAIYEKGLSVVAEGKKSELWSLYLRYLLDVCDRNIAENGRLATENLKLVNEKFEQAHKDLLLPEDFYFFWLKLNKKINTRMPLEEVAENRGRAETNQKYLDIFKKGLQAYPHSLRLWKGYLISHINSDRASEDIPALFEKAIASVKENAVELWLEFFNYCKQIKENDYIDSLYAKAMRDPQVATALAPKYVEWTWTNYGIDRCRAVYDTFVKQQPHCRDIHNKMLKVEFMEFGGDYERWEKVYKNALDQFPHDIDLWEDYMQFHVRYKRSSEEAMSALYAKAMNALPDALQLLLRHRVSSDDT